MTARAIGDTESGPPDGGPDFFVKGGACSFPLAVSAQSPSGATRPPSRSSSAAMVFMASISN
jgi:hypothetical protein